MADQKKQMTVFYFARWYPHRFDPMFGLFIRRHAEAAALYARIGVVYAHLANENQPILQQEMEYVFENGVHTVRVYFPSSSCKIWPLRQLFTLIAFFKANFEGRKKLTAILGEPDVQHIHILTRLGIIGLLYKWRRQIPFVVSEHWSRYLPTGQYAGWLRKWLTGKVVQNASGITTVTENLAQAMQKGRNLVGAPYEVMPNVVDSVFFKTYPEQKTTKLQKSFLHVSCFEDKSKNISGLLRAISLLAQKRSDFKLVLVGDGQDWKRMKDYARELSIPEHQIEFTGLLTGEKLALQMSKADLLLVTSHYENLPVVIIESFVLGIPVMATQVGGIAEIMNNDNGVLLEPEHEIGWVTEMERFLNGDLKFDPELIKKQAHDVYSMEAVGQRLMSFYQKALQKK